MKASTSNVAYERAKRELLAHLNQGPPSVVDVLLTSIGADNTAPTCAPQSTNDAFTDSLNARERRGASTACAPGQQVLGSAADEKVSSI